MDLDGAFADAEFGRDEFVRLTATRCVRTLPVRAATAFRNARALPICALRSSRTSDRALQRLVHALQQVVFAERFAQEVERAAAHRFHRHRNVAVAGDEDDRERGVALVQRLLQFQAGHVRHPHVEHETAAHLVVVGVQEIDGGAYTACSMFSVSNSMLMESRTASSSSMT